MCISLNSTLETGPLLTHYKFCSGIVAIEFAKIFSNLGCDDVTLLIRDNSPKNALMKIGLDRDVAATLVADLLRSGIKIERGCEVGTLDVPPPWASNSNFIAPLKISLKAKGGTCDRPGNCVQELKADAYVAAVGRLANTDRLNLEAVGVEIDSYGGITVDSSLRAKGPFDGNVYGAGDVLGRPFLASTGVAQGIAAVKNMFSSPDCSDDGSTDISCVTDEDGRKSFGVEDQLLNELVSFDPSSLAANPVSISFRWNSE